MVFDESEVRKIIIDCKKVLDYLAVSEVIESIEDLVQFVKDLSPFLSKVMHGYSSIHNCILNNTYNCTPCICNVQLQFV